MLNLQELLAFMAQHTGFWITVWVILGALFGSFFNAMAWRWPQMINREWLEEIKAGFDGQQWAFPAEAQEELDKPKIGFSFPRSQCPHCHSPIPIWRNVPIFSWLALRGKCADCHAPISPRYLFVEIGCAVLGGVLAAFLAPSVPALCLLGFCFTLALIAAIDAASFYIPDALSYGLLWAGLMAHALGWIPGSAQSAIYGALIGFLFLRAIGWLGRVLFKREALGLGDSKLLAAQLAWLGGMALPPLLIAASFLGILVAFVGWAISRATGRPGRAQREIPFGPYLAIAGVLCIFFETPFWAHFGVLAYFGM